MDDGIDPVAGVAFGEDPDSTLGPSPYGTANFDAAVVISTDLSPRIIDPIQQIEPLFDSESMTRLGGGLQAVAGAAETTAGLGLMTFSEFCPPAAPLGYAIAFHGIDTSLAGFLTMVSGERVDTTTSLAIQAAGADRETANSIDGAIGVIGTTAGPAILNTVAAPTLEGMIARQSAIMVYRSPSHMAVGVRQGPEQIWSELSFYRGDRSRGVIQFYRDNTTPTEWIIAEIPLTQKQAGLGLEYVRSNLHTIAPYEMMVNTCSTHVANTIRSTGLPLSVEATRSAQIAPEAVRIAGDISNKLDEAVQLRDNLLPTVAGAYNLYAKTSDGRTE